MKTKTFEAVAASRKWRGDTGLMLDAMNVPERVAYLEGLRKRAVEKVARASCPPPSGGSTAANSDAISPGFQACGQDARATFDPQP